MVAFAPIGSEADKAEQHHRPTGGKEVADIASNNKRGRYRPQFPINFGTVTRERSNRREFPN